MSVSLTSDHDYALFDTVTGMPVQTEVFETEDQADAFREFANEHGVDLRTAFGSVLDQTRRDFNQQWAELHKND